jgi:hypothetical protein
MVVVSALSANGEEGRLDFHQGLFYRVVFVLAKYYPCIRCGKKNAEDGIVLLSALIMVSYFLLEERTASSFNMLIPCGKLFRRYKILWNIGAKSEYHHVRRFVSGHVLFFIFSKCLGLFHSCAANVGIAGGGPQFIIHACRAVSGFA